MINGHEGAAGNGILIVGINGVLYMFNSRDSGITEEQLMKMAKSL